MIASSTQGMVALTYFMGSKEGIFPTLRSRNHKHLEEYFKNPDITPNYGWNRSDAPLSISCLYRKGQTPLFWFMVWLSGLQPEEYGL